METYEQDKDQLETGAAPVDAVVVDFQHGEVLLQPKRCNQHARRRNSLFNTDSTRRKPTQEPPRRVEGIQVIVKNIQRIEGLSLLDVRNIFDALIAEHPGVESYLETDAAVVHQPEFEDACVSVLLNKRDSLTPGKACPRKPQARIASCSSGDHSLPQGEPPALGCEDGSRITEELKYHVGLQAIKLGVRAVLNGRYNRQAKELQVLKGWQGLEAEEYSWESLESISSAVPERVKEYLINSTDNRLKRFYSNLHDGVDGSQPLGGSADLSSHQACYSSKLGYINGLSRGSFDYSAIDFT
ncbi:unnamed protein product [Phytophthora fragariaefolia]|uniref:Unnamed protein product n=1 Tax=Phytophthora fragariaefolia TaxID=1490495 RepID=A0A9W6XJQ8_9STRA|nr:unnamed protein product [Phytophthora fragariaefolia]